MERLALPLIGAKQRLAAFLVKVTSCGHVFPAERDWEDDDEDCTVSDAGGASAPASGCVESAPEPADDDQDIVLAFQRGEARRALSLCVQRHGTRIGRLCMSMLGSQVDADDVTQETLLTAHQAFAEFRQQGTLRAWLLGIARNKCLQLLERHRRSRLRLVRDAGADTATGPHDPLALERAQQARALLERVRPSDRDALLLRYCGELSFREVAAACGIEEAAARKRVSRALLALRSTLEKEKEDD
jgi:RNA polymerase sigma-70 factor (ECF subfamily)